MKWNMKYSGRQNKALILRTILLIYLFVVGLIQTRNWYSTVLNNKACSTKDSKLAEKYFSKAIKLNSTNPLIFANMGLFYMKSDSTISINIFRKGVKLSSPNLNRALYYFIQAQRINPNDSRFCLNLGFLYSMKGEDSKGISFLERTINLSNNNYASLCLGLIYERKGQLSNAKNLFVKSIASAPEIIESQFFRDLESRDSVFSNLILESAKKQLSINYLKTKDPLIQAKLGKVLLSLHDITKAKTLLNGVSKLMPNLNRPWLYLGYIAELEHDSVTAKRYYQKAQVLDETDSLSIFYYKNITNNNQPKSIKHNINAISSSQIGVIEFCNGVIYKSESYSFTNYFSEYFQPKYSIK